MLGMKMWVSSVAWSTILVQTEISFQCIPMKFCTELYGPQRMSHTYFGHPMITSSTFLF